ncbi:MAG TPA: polyphenol oxidase family protein [Candidatus Limnocylindria bacterium]|nr:polyphenol oxidase family protein [Candidatus Limnocylindria bacterium]
MTVATAEWPLVSGLYRSPLLSSLGLVAGFTSASSGSMGGSVFPLADQARAREGVARSLGFEGVARVKQVHGDRVLRADAPFAEPWPEADAVWTDRRGVLLAVAAADCVPILVASPDGPIGAAHAGWEGTSRRIAQALIRTLAAHGADAGSLRASIGPSIGPCCYAIDEERARTIRGRLGGDAADALRADQGGRAVFDLWGANATQLEAAGVRHVELAGLCTRCGGADLWSYRARHERGPQGTGMAVLGWPR